MAVTFQWYNAYSIHDPVIDKEHRELLCLANELFAIANPLKERERFRVALKQLLTCLESHFIHEEQLMTIVDFPDRRVHFTRHDEIIDQMNTLLKSCKSLGELSGKLKDFMQHSILKHIAQEDKKIAASVVLSRARKSCRKAAIGSAESRSLVTCPMPERRQGWAFLGQL